MPSPSEEYYKELPKRIGTALSPQQVRTEHYQMLWDFREIPTSSSCVVVEDQGWGICGVRQPCMLCVL